MNTPRILALLLLGHGLATAEPHGEPYESTGKLTAGRFWSSHSTGPELAWRIRHPQTFSDLVYLDPTTRSLTARKAVRLRVNVVGLGKKTSRAPHRTALWLRAGKRSDWRLVFDGTPKTLSAMTPVLDQTVPANTRIDLAARGHGGRDGTWLGLRSTGAPDHGIKALVNADPLPAPMAAGPEAFLSAWLSPAPEGAEARTVTAGPKDLLLCFELSEARPGDSAHDLQDLVVLLSVEEL